MRRIALCLLTVLLLVCTVAVADSARVVTPGGKLNMRKTADAKGRLAGSVPNGAWVEVTETGDEWCRIVYKKTEGYVKTEYLLLDTAMAGMTLCADDGAMLLRAAPEEDSAIAGVSAPREPVDVLSVENGWALVRNTAGAEGYVSTSLLSEQRETSDAEVTWFSRAGVMLGDQPLLREKNGVTDGTVTAGSAVTVTMTEDDLCLVVTDSGCGWVPTEAVQLSPVTELDGDDLTVLSVASAAAEKSLKKKYKSFAKQQDLYCAAATFASDGLTGVVCGYEDEEGRVLYSALTDSEGKTLCVMENSGFGFVAPVKASLPVGELNAAVSAESLGVGGVLDITAEAWEGAQYTYTLTGESTVFDVGPCDHQTAAWRPRETGAYTLTVTAADDAGHTAEKTWRITVTAATDTAQPEVYSQKDGWWKDKAYRNSNLEHSGCAIFTLSHALHLMGYTGEATNPENLAKTYALCLTVDGTNNERLINTAGQDYGFKTQGELIESEKRIVSLLNEGCLFSFSVARGHIALVCGVSTDGTMVKVMDSAPSATFERLVNASIYVETRSGRFKAIQSLDEVPGARWYPETDMYGGLTYWMKTSYAAKRGVRLIRPLTAQSDD